MDDPLSTRIKTLKKLAETDINTNSNSPIERVREETTRIHKFWTDVVKSTILLWHWILHPMYRILSKPVRWIFWKHVWLWNKTAYTNFNGTKQLSKKRGAIIILIYSLFAYEFFTPTVIFVWQVVWYISTSKVDEEIFLNLSEEIDPANNVFAVSGCKIKPCSDNDTISFRVRSTWFNQWWSILHGKGIFYPDYIAHAVSPGLNRCLITSYGIRQKIFMRAMQEWDIYPDLLAIHYCIPTKEEE